MSAITTANYFASSHNERQMINASSGDTKIARSAWKWVSEKLPAKKDDGYDEIYSGLHSIIVLELLSPYNNAGWWCNFTTLNSASVEGISLQVPREAQLSSKHFYRFVRGVRAALHIKNSHSNCQ